MINEYKIRKEANEAVGISTERAMAMADIARAIGYFMRLPSGEQLYREEISVLIRALSKIESS